MNSSKCSGLLSKDNTHTTPPDIKDEQEDFEEALMLLYDSALKNNDYEAALRLIRAEYELICEKNTYAVCPQPTTNEVCPQPTTNEVCPQPTTNEVCPQPTTNEVCPQPTTNEMCPQSKTNDQAVLLSQENVVTNGIIDNHQNKCKKMSRERKYFVSSVDEHHYRRKMVPYYRGKHSKKNKKQKAGTADGGTLDETQFDKENIFLSEFSFIDEGEKKGYSQLKGS